MSILVLGLGNQVMTDDALGGRVIEVLQQRFVFPDHVCLLDGGTLGLDLLPRFEGINKLLVVDALEMGAEGGTIFRLADEEVPRAFANKLSVHQMGLQDLLAVSELQGHLPPELVVWGAQSESIEMGTELSEAMAPALEKIIAAVVKELSAWGAAPLRVT
jgi:hydrogenase maturation protease